MGVRTVIGKYGTDFNPAVLNLPLQVVVAEFGFVYVFLGHWLRTEPDRGAIFRIHLGEGRYWTPNKAFESSPPNERVCYC